MISVDTVFQQRITTKRAPRAIALLALLAGLAGCNSGGSEGDQVGFGDGQTPDPVALEFPIFYVQRPLPVDEMGEPAHGRLA